ncbi:MAG: hypothetical protein DWQ01_15350 [Planctomycetota bacterium]|nr:MAG: hypothetical protein DWQ01_15350 [Planctomycetota bacterium]
MHEAASAPFRPERLRFSVSNSGSEGKNSNFLIPTPGKNCVRNPKTLDKLLWVSWFCLLQS